MNIVVLEIFIKVDVIIISFSFRPGKYGSKIAKGLKVAKGAASIAKQLSGDDDDSDNDDSGGLLSWLKFILSCFSSDDKK